MRSGDFNRFQKSSDAQGKYDAAIKYYKSADYIKALQLFEQLLSIYRGTKRLKIYRTTMLIVITMLAIM